MRAPMRTSSGSPIRSRSRCSAWLVAGCDRPIRIAARLTLASMQQRVERDQQIEVKRIQIHGNEYISYLLSIGRMTALRRDDLATSADHGEAAMSAAANKKLVQQVYAGSPPSRSGTTFVDQPRRRRRLDRHRPVFVVA